MKYGLGIIVGVVVMVTIPASLGAMETDTQEELTEETKEKIRDLLELHKKTKPRPIPPLRQNTADYLNTTIGKWQQEKLLEQNVPQRNCTFQHLVNEVADYYSLKEIEGCYSAPPIRK